MQARTRGLCVTLVSNSERDCRSCPFVAAVILTLLTVNATKCTGRTTSYDILLDLSHDKTVELVKRM